MDEYMFVYLSSLSLSLSVCLLLDTEEGTLFKLGPIADKGDICGFICSDAFLLLDRWFFSLFLSLALYLIISLFRIKSRGNREKEREGGREKRIGWWGWWQFEMLYGNMSHQLSNWRPACNWLVIIHSRPGCKVDLRPIYHGIVQIK